MEYDSHSYELSPTLVLTIYHDEVREIEAKGKSLNKEINLEGMVNGGINECQRDLKGTKIY